MAVDRKNPIPVDELPPSMRLYISLETVASALALLLTVGSIILFFFDPEWGTRVFSWIFYPVVIGVVLTLFLAISQLCRNFELLILLPIVPALASVVFIIMMIVNQVALWGYFILPPFSFL